MKKAVIHEIMNEAQERRILKRLLKLSPKVTSDNLIRINKTTWIVKREGEDTEEVKCRFRENQWKNKLNNIIAHLYESQ
jgi:hypothetical protein